jgi:hypothetical protein
VWNGERDHFGKFKRTWLLIVRVRNEDDMVMSVMNMLHSAGDEVMQTGKWNIYQSHRRQRLSGISGIMAT